MNERIRDTILAALDESATIRGAMTEEEHAEWVARCDEAIDYVEQQTMPAWERVPDGYYGDLSVEDDGRVIGFYFDDELGYAGADLPDGMVLMRPATAAGEEGATDGE